MVVQLGGIHVHNLMGDLYGIMMFKLRLDGVVRILVWMVCDKEVFDGAVADGSLVDGKGSGKLAVLAYPDFVE